MRRLLAIFKLLLPLQGLDEGLLGKVLGVGHVAHNAINLHKNPA
jgi:hypothetical protein